MARIQWNDSYSINFREIDTQHKRLVEMINNLDDAMRQGKGKETLGKIINGLIVYTKTHFETEEKYFDEFEYPDTAEHKREHAAFVNKVNDFKAGFQSGKLGLSIDVMNFLSDWLVHHIKETDKKYAPFLREKELAAC